MEFTAVIKSIGAKAFEKHVYILFDESITADIAEVSIQQEFKDKENLAQFDIKAGDAIEIDGQSFNVQQVGRLVNDNLKDIAHAVVMFGPIEGEPMENTIYLDGDKNQDHLFKSGSTITYKLK
ncbi:PTS glucitol/sorbitol transporter subunit IIA [Holzapfeliella sp. He02]|uniref:PTS glucitol/sorbitol transporter subunit IIA n=1 Tax=Holzapfeliella saturejae TaxID=3082953 RepID=A0ABU8SFM7_9LACO